MDTIVALFAVDVFQMGHLYCMVVKKDTGISESFNEP